MRVIKANGKQGALSTRWYLEIAIRLRQSKESLLLNESRAILSAIASAKGKVVLSKYANYFLSKCDSREKRCDRFAF